MTHKMLLDSGVDAETISKGGKVLEKAVDDVSRKAYIEYRSALTYRTFRHETQRYEVHLFGITSSQTDAAERYCRF